MSTDASDSKENWDAGVASGDLKVVRRAGPPGPRHVQGQPLDDAGEAKRLLSADQTKSLIETRRLPQSSAKISATAPKGGWPRFDKDGNIIVSGGQ